MMLKHLQEIVVYTIVAVGSMFVLGYAVHMLVGGLVKPETEYALIELVCALDFAAIGYMAWDVIRRRRGKN
jgi:hypothetical protein